MRELWKYHEPNREKRRAAGNRRYKSSSAFRLRSSETTARVVREVKVTLPVTVSIFVRSNTPPPPSTLIGPLTVENAASELAPRKVMVPDALFALTHGGEPEM